MITLDPLSTSQSYFVLSELMLPTPKDSSCMICPASKIGRSCHLVTDTYISNRLLFLPKMCRMTLATENNELLLGFRERLAV